MTELELLGVIYYIQYASRQLILNLIMSNTLKEEKIIEQLILENC